MRASSYACILVIAMIYAVLFNAIMLLLALGVGKSLLPAGFLTSLIMGLHYTIGITTPTEAQVRRAAVVWILCIVVIVDVLLALLSWVL